MCDYLQYLPSDRLILVEDSIYVGSNGESYFEFPNWRILIKFLNFKLNHLGVSEFQIEPEFVDIENCFWGFSQEMPIELRKEVTGKSPPNITIDHFLQYQLNFHQYLNMLIIPEGNIGVILTTYKSGVIPYDILIVSTPEGMKDVISTPFEVYGTRVKNFQRRRQLQFANLDDLKLFLKGFHSEILTN